MQFHTDYKYTDRETKAKYVWEKYGSILRGVNILDVGADKCYLRQHLSENASYWGIGLGGDTDQEINLERDQIPFADNTYDCVLCLDVLEHLDNIYEVFDELCRVSRRYVIISLPNPWADFYSMLRIGNYRDDRPMKYYGLPAEPPQDRHKWFFSVEEAEQFVAHRAVKNGLRVLQIDHEGMGRKGRGWTWLAQVLAGMILLRRNLSLKNLYASTLWAVLEKREDGKEIV